MGKYRKPYFVQRCIVMEDSRVRIFDRVNSERDITCRQVFHLAPWNIILSGDRTQATIFFNYKDIIFEQINKNCKFRLKYCPAFNNRNEMTYSPTSLMNGMQNKNNLQA